MCNSTVKNAKLREIRQGITTVARMGHGEVFFFDAAVDLVLVDGAIGDLPSDGVFIGVGLGNGELTPPVTDVADGIAADVGVILTGTVSASTTNAFTFFLVESIGSDGAGVVTADANCFVIVVTSVPAVTTDSLVLFLAKSKLTTFSLLCNTFSLLCNALKTSSSLIGPGV